jgi:deoxyribodipyrimidine photo-lyase
LLDYHARPFIFVGMTDKPIAIVWFRQDLRLHDNTALIHAINDGFWILPVFILDDESAGLWKRGGAQRWWLHQSLQSLNHALKDKLVMRRGPADQVLTELIKTSGAKAVFWNRCYEPWRIARDKKIKEQLQQSGITSQSFKDALLWEPWEVAKEDGTPYKVFTPYYRRGCLSAQEPSQPVQTPKSMALAEFESRGKIEDLDLLPQITWYKSFEPEWEPGESGAQKRFEIFLKEGLSDYKEGRNRPDWRKVSRLSPHLHHGEISIRQVWHTARAYGIANRLEKDMDHFCSELGWREFSYSLLYYNQDLPREPLQKRFKDFPWDDVDPAVLSSWQKGQTGIPIVDAGMRELWQTGWMHNRVRMIVASLLVKNMLLHWHHGEEWFWDCLLDADLANNSASWQWVSGCGADAAPYFRVFNPVTQGEKFDPDGSYVRRYVPELADMPREYIHQPWTASPLILKAAGVTLGSTYPHPIVDLKETRQKALDAFAQIRQAA